MVAEAVLYKFVCYEYTACSMGVRDARSRAVTGP
jgi:hypothetical protein